MKSNTSHWINQNDIIYYLTDIKKHQVLSRDQEFEIIKELRNGNSEAKEKLILANLRFVISIAKQYLHKGLDLQDLISEGNYGLLKAFEKYDINQTEVRFISYAVWWIRQSIIQALNEHSRSIRLPVNVINDIYKLEKEADKIGEFNPYINKISIPKVETLDKQSDEESYALHDVIADSDAVMADSTLDIEKENLNYALISLLDTLNDIEKQVITRYFGLFGNENTLQEIAEDLDLTKERVRQIKEKAIKKLRFNSYKLFELL
jgi:RNA polymerase primary sigma factor